MQNLVRNSEETQCLEEISRGKCQCFLSSSSIVNSIPFCFFSLYLYLLPFSILSLLSLHHPFFLFWSILCPSKIKTSIYYILFTNGTFFCILFTPWHFNNAFYKLEKNQILMLELQLVIPWGLEETMAPVLILTFSSFPLASLPSLLALLINSLSS